MSAPRLDISFCFSLPAALRGGNGEAHRVGPVLLVGLHVLGFLFHRRISLRVILDPGITGTSAGDSGVGPPKPARLSRPAY